MKKIFLSILFLFIGVLLGGYWANHRINQVGKDPNLILRNGVWGYFPSMDLAASDIQRAYIGRIGLLALKESEVMYFVAAQDEDGNPLSSENDYKLSGENFDARYWSYTLYGADHFLIPNQKNQFTFNLENVEYSDSTQTNYDIFISKNEKPGNWLPSGDEKTMSILLRLYNPAERLYQNKDQLSLPKITKIN